MTMDYSTSCFLQKLVSVCVSVSEVAGKLIKNVADGGNLKVFNKGTGDDFDPQTEADRISQKFIVGKLREMFPKLKIIAEEGEMNEDFSGQILDSISPNEFVLSQKCPEEYVNLKEDEVIVWVDPLDATSSFLTGTLEPVSVLIGVATVDGTSIAGIIHFPFSRKNLIGSRQQSSGAFHPKTIWGIVGVGAYGLEDKSHLKTASTVAVVSKLHSSPFVKCIIDKCGFEQCISLSGCGFKGVYVLEGAADLMLYEGEGTRKWDTCALDAIFTIVGGSLTATDGEKYSYSPNMCSMNEKGVLAVNSFGKNYIKAIQDIYLTFK